MPCQATVPPETLTRPRTWLQWSGCHTNLLYRKSCSLNSSASCLKIIDTFQVGVSVGGSGVGVIVGGSVADGGGGAVGSAAELQPAMTRQRIASSAQSRQALGFISLPPLETAPGGGKRGGVAPASRSRAALARIGTVMLCLGLVFRVC